MKKKIIYLSIIGGVLIIALIIGTIKINSKESINISDQNAYALENENITNDVLEENIINENVTNEITDNQENIDNNTNEEKKEQIEETKNENNNQSKTEQKPVSTTKTTNSQTKATTTSSTKTSASTQTQSKSQEAPKPVETKKYGSVFIKNVSTYDNSSLSADQVEIYKDVNGDGFFSGEDYKNKLKTTSISTSGTTVSGLEVGKYFAKVMKNTKNYYAEDVSFSISENKTTTLTIKSKPRPSNLQIVSKDASTGELISGFNYSVIFPKGGKLMAYENNGKGKCYIDNPGEVGTYKITVNQVNSAYNVTTQTKTIDLKPGRGTEELVFTYTKK